MKKNERKNKMIDMKIFRSTEGKTNRDEIAVKIFR
jgi:hypothetical protein